MYWKFGISLKPQVLTLIISVAFSSFSVSLNFNIFFYKNMNKNSHDIRMLSLKKQHEKGSTINKCWSPLSCLSSDKLSSLAIDTNDLKLKQLACELFINSSVFQELV